MYLYWSKVFFYAFDGSEDSLIREEIPQDLDDSDDKAG